MLFLQKVMENKAITVLDGGLSSELRKQFNVKNDPLWSARFLHTNPSAIVDVHKKFLESGCDILTTVSYQASIEGFLKHLELPEEKCINLLKSSVELAKQAVKEYFQNSKQSRQISIAGSIGPYAVSLADGSEYTGDYCNNLSHEDLIKWHRPKIQHLLDKGVDYLAFETIPAAKEAEALMKLLNEFSGIKAWLSFSCKSGSQTAHKEDIGKTAKQCLKIAPAGQLIAVGVNCCAPDYVENLLKCISSEISQFPLIAYPNSGEKWINGSWVDERQNSLVSYVPSWIAAGAKIIGGCCRTTPDEIAEVVKYVRNRKI